MDLRLRTLDFRLKTSLANIYSTKGDLFKGHPFFIDGSLAHLTVTPLIFIKSAFKSV